jgi:hypothetical protein
MKTINSLLVALVTLFALSFLMPSCGKKTTPAPATNVVTTPTYTFSAFGITATGVQYSITNPNTGPLKISASNSSSSNSTNYQTVDITINSAVNSVGTYPLSSSSGNTGLYTSGGNTVRYTTNATYTGNLTISSIDMIHKTITASYNFSAHQYYPSSGSGGSISGSFTNVSFQ